MGSRGQISKRKETIFGSSSVEESQNKKKSGAKEIIEQPKLKKLKKR